MKIKQRQIARLREDHFTRDLCPGVRPEDWALACVFRHPHELRHCIPQLYPRYMSTATGRWLCRKLHEFKEAAFISLRDLERHCRIQGREHPAQVRKWHALYEHIARLRKIPRNTTRSDYEAEQTILAWCEYRRRLLLPERGWPTDKIESELSKTHEKLLLAQEKEKKLAQRRDRVYQLQRRYRRHALDLIDELKRRPDSVTNVEELQKTFRPPQPGLGLRERLIYRVAHPPEPIEPPAEEALPAAQPVPLPVELDEEDDPGIAEEVG